MTLAAEHLIRLGHKRIAFVGGGRSASPARDRAHAYRETLARYGLPLGPVVNCLPTREEGARAVERLLQRRAERSDRDPLLQRRLRLRRAARARRPRPRRRPRLRRDRLRQHRGGGALPAGADHGRDRRADRSARRPRACCSAGSRCPTAPPESIILPPRLIVRSSCGGDAPNDELNQSRSTFATSKRGTQQGGRRMTRSIAN